MRLWSFERRWLLAIFDTILPGDAVPGLPSGGDAPAPRFADDVFARAPGESLVGVRLAVWLVTLGPVVWRLKLRPFHRLPRPDRVAFLERAASSRLYALRELPNLLKILACTSWAATPAVQRQLRMARPDGSPPPWAGDRTEDRP